jgi:hypothetical protein
VLLPLEPLHQPEAFLFVLLSLELFKIQYLRQYFLNIIRTAWYFGLKYGPPHSLQKYGVRIVRGVVWKQ